jgi:UDP-N-acetylenolpyruvoylglucosamine reductase
LGSARAGEIWNVIYHVQREVMAAKGVELRTEVVRLGDW